MCTSGLQLWSWGAHGRTPFVFPPCLRGLYLSARQRWWKGAIGDALQLGTGAAPRTIRAVGPGSAARLLLPQHHSGGCHSCLAGHTAKTIRCHTAKPGVPAALGPAGTHPPSLTVRPAPAWSPVLLGGVTLTDTSTLKEPQSLVEYLGLQLVRQEGVSNTGNAHPIGSGWLHTAPLPSARKESASATLPPHMVTYNTSGFSFPLLSFMCLIF